MHIVIPKRKISLFKRTFPYNIYKNVNANNIKTVTKIIHFSDNSRDRLSRDILNFPYFVTFLQTESPSDVIFLKLRKATGAMITKRGKLISLISVYPTFTEGNEKVFKERSLSL